MEPSTTPPTRPETKPHMELIGYVLFAGVLLLLVPLAPVIAGLWVLDRFTGEDRVGRVRRTVDRQQPNW